MENKNPIRTLGDYSRPSHEGYRNTIKLPDGNNVVPLRSDTIELVQNGCSFHGLWSKNPNQHLKDFRKLVDSLDLDVANRERTRLHTRLSKFEADFKQQQGEMTNKIDMFLKAINDRMTRALPSDTVKNPKLNVNFTSSVLSARSYPIEDPQGSSRPLNSINAIIFKGIKSPSKLLSRKYQSRSSLRKPIRNSSSPKRVHFINTITILSKEDELGETKIVKQDTKDNDHESIVKVEEKSKDWGAFAVGQPPPEEGASGFGLAQKGGVRWLLFITETTTKRWCSVRPAAATAAPWRCRSWWFGLGSSIAPRGNAPDIFPARHILGGYSSPKRVHFINTITILSKEDEPEETKIVKQDTKDNDHESIVKVEEKKNDEDVMFVELIKKYDDSSEEGLEVNENAVTEEELGVEYFDRFPTRSELAYHKYLVCAPIPSLFLRNPIIIGGSPSNLKIRCNIGHVHIKKAYIDLNSSINVMTHMQYNWIMRKQLEPREDPEGIRRISNFTRRTRGMRIFVGNFTYILDFMIVKDISSIIDPRLSQVVLGKPFVEVSNMTHDSSIGVVKFTIEENEIAYKMPHKIEQYNSQSDLEKEHTKLVYFRNAKTREEE
ncbi:hypothetical protein Tco_0241724 [Tanacetum coccineum]